MIRIKYCSSALYSSVVLLTFMNVKSEDLLTSYLSLVMLVDARGQ